MIQIPSRIGKLITRDLASLDESRIRIILLEANLKTYQEIIDQNKLIMQSYERTISIDKNIIQNTEKQVSLYKSEVQVITKKYKAQVRKSRFLIVVSIGAIGFGIYQTLK